MSKKYFAGKIIGGIGFGAWQLGNKADWYDMSQAQGVKLVQYAYDQGVNFFDTAPNYGYGMSETILGKALKNLPRESFAVNTKVGHHADGQQDYSKDLMEESVDNSLNRLQMDYLDSVIVHNPPKELLQDPSYYQVLDSLVEKGKILAYGASVDSAEEMQLFLDHSKGQVMEVFFNILHQDTRQLFQQAKAQGVHLIAKIPLDSGWLSGKYDADSRFKGIRARWRPEDIQTRAQLLAELKAHFAGREPISQLALAYCLSYDEVDVVIPGMSKTSYVDGNIASLDIELTSEDKKWLETFYEDKVKPLNLVW